MKGSEELEVPSSFTPLRMVLTVMKAKRNGNASAFSVQRAVRHTPAEEQRSDLFPRCWVPYLFRLAGGFPGSPGNAIQSRVTSSHRVVLDSGREGLRQFQRTLRKPNHIVAFLRHTERPITSRLGLRPALPQTFSDHPDCSGLSCTAPARRWRFAGWISSTTALLPPLFAPPQRLPVPRAGNLLHSFNHDIRVEPKRTSSLIVSLL